MPFLSSIVNRNALSFRSPFWSGPFRSPPWHFHERCSRRLAFCAAVAMAFACFADLHRENSVRLGCGSEFVSTRCSKPWHVSWTPAAERSAAVLRDCFSMTVVTGRDGGAPRRTLLRFSSDRRSCEIVCGRQALRRVPLSLAAGPTSLFCCLGAQ